MSPLIAMAVSLVADQFTGSARKGETARTESSGAKNANFVMWASCALWGVLAFVSGLATAFAVYEISATQSGESP